MEIFRLRISQCGISCRGCFVLLLVIHTLLLAASAWMHSPTRDEWGHLPAGVSHWQLGQFDLYRVNPPLVRMVAALPVLPYAPQIE